MKIECLTMRDGATPVQVGKSGHKYMFQERRDALSPQEGPTTSFYDVQTQEHIDQLLKFPNFRVFDPKVPPPAQNAVMDMGNYHIEKHVDGKTEGYRCVKKSPRQYAGTDGIWKDTLQNLVPFATEYSAYDWLMQEVKMGQSENNLKQEGTKTIEEKEPDVEAERIKAKRIENMAKAREARKNKNNTV